MAYVGPFPLPVAIGGTGSISGAFVQVGRQVFTTSGTYTPTSGMTYCDIEVCGGGGGAGGTATPIAANGAISGAGGAGGYSRGIFTASSIGSSQSVTVGTGGAGAATNTTGATGVTSSVGSLISATGGVGGSGGATLATL